MYRAYYVYLKKLLKSLLIEVMAFETSSYKIMYTIKQSNKYNAVKELKFYNYLTQNIVNQWN